MYAQNCLILDPLQGGGGGGGCISNKYYSVGDLQKLKISKNFNIFHSNVNCLENKMDLLHEFLSSTSSDC